jgi:hypothetical protein
MYTDAELCNISIDLGKSLLNTVKLL